MTPEEFAKLMQARQDKAISERSSKPSFSAQRVHASKNSQNDSRLIITSSKEGVLETKFVETILRERTHSGNVLSMSPTELAISFQGNKQMYITMEIILARIFSHGAFKGIEQFSIRGQWDKFPSRTGNFTKQDVAASDFNTIE